MSVEGFDGVGGGCEVWSARVGEECEELFVLEEAFEPVVHAPVAFVGVPPFLACGCCLFGVLGRVGAFFEVVGVFGVEGGEQARPVCGFIHGGDAQEGMGQAFEGFPGGRVGVVGQVHGVVAVDMHEAALDRLVWSPQGADRCQGAACPVGSDDARWGKWAEELGVGRSVFSSGGNPVQRCAPVGGDEDDPGVGKEDPVNEHLVMNDAVHDWEGWWDLPTPRGALAEGSAGECAVAFGLAGLAGRVVDECFQVVAASYVRALENCRE